MDRKFEQQLIKPTHPGNDAWPSLPHIKRFLITMVEITLGSKKSMGIAYQYAENVEPESTIYADQLDFAIIRDFTEIELYLDHTIDWRWSTKLDGFTTKNRVLTDYYGELQYDVKNDGKNFKKLEDWSPETEFTAIKFKARLKTGKKDSHPFSLNVELKQADGKWLAITIDPDVRNPPTGPEDKFVSKAATKSDVQRLKFFSSEQIDE